MDFASTRRRFLRTALAGTAVGLAGCAESADDPQATDSTGTTASDSTATGTTATDSAPAETTASDASALPDAVGLETLASGLQGPLDVAFAPEADRRYVAEQRGLIWVHGADGVRDRPFLDLRDSVEVSYEKGLLGVALHPNFAENRRAFVRYSAPSRSGTPEGYSHTFVLAEFAVTEDGTRARRDSERAVLEIPEPQSNHNAGDLAFGPDGYLYVAVGDGGGGGDQGTGHVDDWYDGVSGGNGQDVTENLLGSVLRIDVDSEPSSTARTGGGGTADSEPSGDRAYAVPDDNPLVGREGLDEHYAWGLRNPWRLSFDRGDLFVADVGQSSYEEVNLVEKGGNYGWNVREGAHCFRADDCPTSTPESVRGGEPLRDPIVEYPHSGGEITGSSVIGGYVYRGSEMPGLTGVYVFGDLSAGGRLFVASRPDDGGATTGESGSGSGSTWPTRVLDVTDDDAGKLQQILSFGRDPAGEVYVLGSGDDGGGLHRIVPAE